MPPTKLLYLENFTALECEARVLDVKEENGRTVVTLEQTVFYPQGGGQPYDKGVIESPAGKFIVEEVRFADGVVKHIGAFEKGILREGETVICGVARARRELLSKIHSAGHVVDWAVARLDLGWTPGKGYHFPDSPYVEYAGSLGDSDKEKLRAQIEEQSNAVIREGRDVSIRFMPKEDMRAICRFVPEYIPEDKPGRVVLFGDFGVPCGGTHVRNLKEIKAMTIRKIKAAAGTIRVAYDVIKS